MFLIAKKRVPSRISPDLAIWTYTFHFGCKFKKIGNDQIASSIQSRFWHEILVFSARKRLGNTLEKHWKGIHHEKPAKHRDPNGFG